MLLRTKFLLALVFANCFAFMAHADQRITQEYPVSQLQSVEVMGAGTLVLTQGNTDTLKIVGEPDDLASIKVDLTNNRLTISSGNNTKGWRNWFSNHMGKVEYLLQVKNINELKLSGAVNAQLNDMTSEKLHLDLSGAVNIDTGKLRVDLLRTDASGAVNFTADSIQAKDIRTDISGAVHWIIKNNSTAESIKVNASGAADVQAKPLMGSQVYVDASGAAHISIGAEKELDARASGASNIEYHGNARVKQDTSGVSHVNKM